MSGLRDLFSLASHTSALRSNFQTQYRIICISLAVLTCLTWLIAHPEFKSSQPVAEKKTLLQSHVVVANRDVKDQLIAATDPSETGQDLKAMHSPLILKPETNDWKETDTQYYLFRARLENLLFKRPIFKEKRKTLLHLSWKNSDKRRHYASIDRLSGLPLKTSIVEFVTLPSHVDALELQLRVNKGGTWRISDVSLQAVKISNAYVLCGALLIASWLIWVVFLLKILRDSGFGVLIGAMIFCITLVFIGLSASRSSLHEFLAPMFDAIRRTGNGSSVQQILSFLDFGHFLAFFMLFIILSPLWLRKRISLSWLMTFLLLVALATESFQLHIAGRSAQIMDIGLDMSGAFSACLLVVLVRLSVKCINGFQSASVDKP